ncbi:MAG: PASTA domain-containing protein, partial [Acidimicrobiales bacterium]
AFIVLLVVMLAALGGLLYLFAKEAGFFGTSTSGLVGVPRVLSLDQAEAERRVTDAGLRPEVQLTPSEQPVGKVFEQNPPADQSVNQGSSVILKVSSGVLQVDVPNVVGRSRDDANAILTEARFRVTERQQPDERVAANTVISQSPAASQKAGQGSQVEIVVSAGRPRVAVPDVTSKDALEAANELGAAQFRTATRREAHPTIPADRVIRTDPAAGTQAERGSTVTVIVSTGPDKARVPNVVDDTEGNATVTLQTAGFRVTVQPTLTLDANRVGRVISQSPSAATEADRGSTVVIQVGRSLLSTSTTAPGSTTTTVAGATTTTRP